MYKLLVAAAVIAVASCEAEAEADPGYFYGAYPALYNAYPNWPGVSGPGFSSTTFGARGLRVIGKRSADAEADADAFYGAYGYGLAPYAAYAPYYYGYGLPGVAGHPTGTSYVARSVQGLRLGKRSADAEADADADAHYYGGYGYGGYGGYGYAGYPYRAGYGLGYPY